MSTKAITQIIKKVDKQNRRAKRKEINKEFIAGLESSIADGTPIMDCLELNDGLLCGCASCADIVELCHGNPNQLSELTEYLLGQEILTEEQLQSFDDMAPMQQSIQLRSVLAERGRQLHQPSI